MVCPQALESAVTLRFVFGVVRVYYTLVEHSEPLPVV